MALTETALDTLLGALDDVGDPGIVHVERLAARPARTGEPVRPLPAEVRDALGVSDLWTHQAAAIDLARAGRSVAVATGTASGKSLCYQAPIAEAVLDPVRPGHRAAASSHQGAGPGPARARSPRSGLPRPRGLRLRRRLHARGPDLGPRARQRSLLTNPEMLHCGLLPHHERWATFLHAAALRRGRRAAHAAGHLRHRTSPTCCAACGGCAPATGRRPRSSSPRPPSASRPAWPRRCAGSRWRRSPTTGRRGASGWSRCGTRRCSTRPPARGRRSRRTTARMVASLVRPRPPLHRLLPQPAGHRGGGRRGPPPAPPAARAARSGPTGAATWPPSGGRSRPSCSTAGCGAWSPPPPSSWASTSAASTPACSTASPARSPRSGSRPAGPAGSSSGRWPCWWPATTSSTSGSMAHPDEVFTRPPEPAVVNPSNPFVLDAHLACAAFELPLTLDDEQWWATPTSTTACAGSSPATGSRCAGSAAASAARSRGGVGGPGVPVPRRRAADAGRAASSASPSPTARWSARSTTAARPAVVHPGACTCTRAGATGSSALDLDERGGGGRARAGRRVHPGAHAPPPSRVLDDELRRAVGRADLHLGHGRGDLAGHRLPAPRPHHRRGARRGAPRPAARPGWSPGRSGT